MNKYSWILVTVVVAVIAFYSGGQRSDQLAKINTPVVASDSRSYTNLVKLFDGKLIDFDAGCQARQSDIIIKNGQEVLIHNASGGNSNGNANASHPIRVTIANIAYDIAADGFKIVRVVATTVPKKYGITCNGNTNVATITVQN